VTVAVLAEPERIDVHLDVKDVHFDYYNPGGPGGQHQNKVAAACRATHVPTGVVARAESERSQTQNRHYALAMLAAKLRDAQVEAARDARTTQRRAQLGSGQRGDKVRTVRAQDGVVTCERTGKKTRLRDYERGELGWLWARSNA